MANTKRRMINNLNIFKKIMQDLDLDVSNGESGLHMYWGLGAFVCFSNCG